MASQELQGAADGSRPRITNRVNFLNDQDISVKQ